MRVIQINATCGLGSTGKICKDLSLFLNDHDVKNIVLYSEGETDYLYSKKYSKTFFRKIATFFCKVFGYYGFENSLETRFLIKELKSFNPDVVHLRNIHNHTLNLRLFFSYIRKTKIKVVWSFDDCWPITGYCTHFDYISCEKWKTRCTNCPLYKEYSYFFDRCTHNYFKKKKYISQNNILITVPSDWMKNIVESSFLSHMRIKKLSYGLDLSIFRPISNCITKINKMVFLFVAFTFTLKKGLDDFLKIAELALSYDGLSIILIGETDSRINLPKNVIHVQRTKDQFELCKYYNMADVYINVTKEETFGMTNLEALACGTPVVTYDTGGSPEILKGANCGCVVAKNDYEELFRKAIIFASKKTEISQSCVDTAKRFDKNNIYNEYLKIYEDEIK